jgi:two-component system, NtrC family, nitrogen regulation response regulator NtrX
MERVRQRIRQAAPTDARVLVTGRERHGQGAGGGAVHHLSRRARGPLVRVNSAAIPKELIESEMFGHEKGAFTGAVERRRGRFEQADGGTLFLDEVADLSQAPRPSCCAPWSRARCSGWVAASRYPVDVRVVAATNTDLARAVAAGDFRDDLFYRLNVLPIDIPPLRDRMEDLPGLVEHLMGRLRDRHGMNPPEITDTGLAALRRYRWPGNVRELANICERLAILHSGATVGAAEVAALLPAIAEETRSLSEQMEAYERGRIEAALSAAEWSVAEAARALKTDRANLYRRMKRLGIER